MRSKLGKARVLETRAGGPRASLPLQGELSLLLLVLHDLGDALLLRELWVGGFGLAFLSVCIVFLRGKVAIV